MWGKAPRPEWSLSPKCPLTIINSQETLSQTRSSCHHCQMRVFWFLPNLSHILQNNKVISHDTNIWLVVIVRRSVLSRHALHATFYFAVHQYCKPSSSKLSSSQSSSRSSSQSSATSSSSSIEIKIGVEDLAWEWRLEATYKFEPLGISSELILRLDWTESKEAIE